jgi:hypothetical protein
MNKKLGVFLNNTENESNYLINYNNYKNLKKNFDNIIVIDLNNNYSLNLKKKIEKNKDIKNEHIIYDSKDFIEKIINIKDKIIDYEIITFIEDKHIYTSKLNDYFTHVVKSNYEFYCLTDSTETDSTENFYHMQLYIFSIKKSIINIFINNSVLFLKNKKNLDAISYKLNYLKYITELFINRSVFVKVAYLDNIINKNILLVDNNFYFELLENDILPIIDINLLNKYNNNYNNNKLTFTEIPDTFNIDIYKQYDDLKNLNNDELKKHFIDHGQFECRKYKLNNHIQKDIIYKCLEKNNLLKYFDFPPNFDMYYYKKNNNDLKLLNMYELKKHWFKFGINEDRIISK